MFFIFIYIFGLIFIFGVIIISGVIFIFKVVFSFGVIFVNHPKANRLERSIIKITSVGNSSKVCISA